MLVKCLLHLKIAKEWNLEECQTFDDGDPYQSVYVQGYYILLTRLRLCVMRMTLSKGISV